VQSGKTLALVGQSGCGKSTIIALMEKYYKPNSGKILVDSIDISQVDDVYYREHLALVSQQPELFDNTIGYNITYGMREPVSREQVEQAAKDANAHAFIMEFEQNYDTAVGEKGAQLSGGQRQRIAIARALLRKDKIRLLLLDEATAALDNKSEHLVQEALERARHGRTTIIVAHRLSTIQSADEIAVIDKGQVVEQGTHEELMAKQGAYYELVQSQQFLATDATPQTQSTASSPKIPHKKNLPKPPKSSPQAFSPNLADSMAIDMTHNDTAQTIRRGRNLSEVDEEGGDFGEEKDAPPGYDYSGAPPVMGSAVLAEVSTSVTYDINGRPYYDSVI